MDSGTKICFPVTIQQTETKNEPTGRHGRRIIHTHRQRIQRTQLQLLGSKQKRTFMARPTTGHISPTMQSMGKHGTLEQTHTMGKITRYMGLTNGPGIWWDTRTPSNNKTKTVPEQPGQDLNRRPTLVGTQSAEANDTHLQHEDTISADTTKHERDRTLSRKHVQTPTRTNTKTVRQMAHRMDKQ